MQAKVLKYLLEKEFKQMLRNPIMLPLIIALPLIQLVILPYAATYEIRNIRIAVVDNDHSQASRALEEKIASSNYFRIVLQASTHQEALQCIRAGSAGMAIEIPADFESDLIMNRPVSVYISADAVDGTKAGIGASYLGQIIRNFAEDVVKEKAVKGLIDVVHQPVPAKVEAVPLFRFNPALDYKTYMVPGILAMLLTLVGGILAALNISSERELGTLEQIKVSPVSKFD
ncbi:MAG: ABC transporter permease, partial [Bacteroidales bacterium]|nr:ABC transporter permease [Bacteroidales bacterium]